MITTSVWKEECPVPVARLSLVETPYIDFEGKEHDDGEVIVLDVLAQPIAALFTRLFAAGFPINKIRPLHEYSGNDDLSMQDNNTSCFCFRNIQGTSTVSVHSYGVALDINPLQNPYLTIEEEQGMIAAHPNGGWRYINRHNKKPGMVEEIVPLLSEHGLFEWGGRWTTPVDYQHFQTPRWLAELLAVLTTDDGRALLTAAVAQREKLSAAPSGDRVQALIDLYCRHKTEFFDKWLEYII